MRFYVGVDCGLIKEVELTLGKEGRKPTKLIKKDIYAHNPAKKDGLTEDDAHEVKQVKIRDLGSISKEAEVQQLCWCLTPFPSVDKAGLKLAWVGRAFGVIDLMDVKTGQVLYTHLDPNKPTNRWVGLHSTMSALYACDNEGTMHMLQFDATKAGDYNPTSVVLRKLYDKKKQVEVLVANPNQPTIVATGGKDLELSVWDLSTLFSNSEAQSQGPLKPLFKARNVPNDQLDLRVPVWVLAARFLRSPTDKSYRVVVGTRYGQVRVYETGVKRAPVINHQVFDSPIFSLDVSADETQVVVANNVGDLKVLHLENGNKLGNYKGITGSIKQVQILNQPQGPEIADQPPLLVSIAIDRFLRIHHFNVNSRALVQRVYLKQRPSALLADESSFILEMTPAKRAREEHESLWNSMDTVPLSKRHSQDEFD